MRKSTNVALTEKKNYHKEKKTEVPFVPSTGRSVYCRECYQNHKPRDIKSLKF